MNHEVDGYEKALGKIGFTDYKHFDNVSDAYSKSFKNKGNYSRLASFKIIK